MNVINVNDILFDLNGGKEDLELTKLINEYILECENIDYKYNYKIFTFDEIKDLLIGENIKDYAKDSKNICVFIVTLNIETDKKLRQLEKVDKLKYLVYDRVLSHLIEDKAILLQEEVKEELLKNNKYMLNRFSTGYGDWPIDVNYSIHKILKADRLGIFLTEKNMFMPSKTISGIIASGDTVSSFNFCKTCNITKECKLIKEGRRCYE